MHHAKPAVASWPPSWRFGQSQHGLSKRCEGLWFIACVTYKRKDGDNSFTLPQASSSSSGVLCHPTPAAVAMYSTKYTALPCLGKVPDLELSNLSPDFWLFFLPLL